MQSYRTLFTLALSHEYFADGAWTGVDFVPTDTARRIVSGCGAVLRRHRNTLSVLYDAGRRAALGMLADETGGEMRLALKGMVRDRTFRNYTALGARIADTVLCFGNDPAVAEPPDGLRLSREETADAADLRPVRDVLGAELLSPAEARMPPDMLLDLRFTAEMLDRPQAPRFRLGFATRSLVWNYILLGNVNRDNLFIVDLDEQVEFEALAETYAVANREGRVFRSKTSLPIHEKSALRFQLRERGNGSGRVVVKRLPVAADNFGIQTVDGEDRLVSNMFVNF